MPSFGVSIFLILLVYTLHVKVNPAFAAITRQLASAASSTWCSDSVFADDITPVNPGASNPYTLTVGEGVPTKIELPTDFFFPDTSYGKLTFVVGDIFEVGKVEVKIIDFKHMAASDVTLTVEKKESSYGPVKKALMWLSPDFGNGGGVCLAMKNGSWNPYVAQSNSYGGCGLDHFGGDWFPRGGNPTCTGLIPGSEEGELCCEDSVNENVEGGSESTAFVRSERDYIISKAGGDYIFSSDSNVGRWGLQKGTTEYNCGNNVTPYGVNLDENGKFTGGKQCNIGDVAGQLPKGGTAPVGTAHERKIYVPQMDTFLGTCSDTTHTTKDACENAGKIWGSSLAGDVTNAWGNWYVRMCDDAPNDIGFFHTVELHLTMKGTNIVKKYKPQVNYKIEAKPSIGKLYLGNPDDDENVQEMAANVDTEGGNPVFYYDSGVLSPGDPKTVTIKYRAIYACEPVWWNSLKINIVSAPPTRDCGTRSKNSSNQVTISWTAVSEYRTQFEYRRSDEKWGSNAPEILDKNATQYQLTLEEGYTYQYRILNVDELGSKSAIVDCPALYLGNMAFFAEPSGCVAGAQCTTQPSVEILELNGITRRDTSATVTIAIGETKPIGANMTGTTTRAAASGLADFALNSGQGIRFDVAGKYSLKASITEPYITSIECSKFTVEAGPVKSLVWGTQPDSCSGGTVCGSQPIIQLFDAYGNIATHSSENIEISIHSSPGNSGTISGTTTLACIKGVANWDTGALAGLKLDKAGQWQLTAIAVSSGVSTKSHTINVAIGTAAQLLWAVKPSNCKGGTACATSATVHVADLGGNIVISSGGYAVTLLLSDDTQPDGGSVSGTLANDVVSGIATFPSASLIFDKIGTYQLKAETTDPALSSVTSVVVTAGPAHSVTWSQEIGTGQCKGGEIFLTQPEITLLDKGGNIATDSTAAVTITIESSNPVNNGATLSGTTKMNIPTPTGKVTFTNLTIDKAPATYVLKASITTPTSIHALSSSFNVEVGAVSHLHWFTQPGSCLGGTPCSVQPLIQARDAGNNVVTAYTGGPTVVVTKKSGTGSLTGTTTIAFVNGVANFGQLDVGNRLKIDKIGSDYVLNAKSSDNLHTSDSSTFSVNVGPAAQLFVSTSIDGCQGGSVCSQQPVIEIHDAGGNTRTMDSSSSVVISKNSGPGSLSGISLSKTVVKGIATFTTGANGLKMNTHGSYTLRASVTDGPSITFSVTVNIGPAASMKFASNFASCSGGVACVGQRPRIEVLDLGLNVVVSSSILITIAVATGPVGYSSLTGDTTENASSGIADFNSHDDLILQKAGTYTFSASASGLPSATSGSMVVTVGPKEHIKWDTAPSGCTGGVVCTTSGVLSIRDAGGNVVITDNSSIVTVSIVPFSSILSGTKARTFSSGLATFSDLSISTAGNYTLNAVVDGMSDVQSSSITVSVGPVVKLVFATSPSVCHGGTNCLTQPIVNAVDAGDNINTSSTSEFTIIKKVGTGGSGKLLGNLPQFACTNGVVKFSENSTDKQIKFDLVGSDYQISIVPKDNNILGDTSSVFSVSVGAAAQLSIVQAMSTCRGGEVCDQQPIIRIVDAGGNSRTNDPTGIASGTGFIDAGIGGCTNIVALKADNNAIEYSASNTPTNTVAKCQDACSKNEGCVNILFGVSGGEANKCYLFQDYCDYDASQTSTHLYTYLTIRVSKGGGPAAGKMITLRSSARVVNSVATFSASDNGLTMDIIGSYTIRYTCKYSKGITLTVDQLNMEVILGPVATIDGVSISGCKGGEVCETQPTLQAKDLGGNVVTTYNKSVVLTMTGAGSLSGTTTKNFSSGTVTFAGLSFNKVGGHTLIANTSPSGGCAGDVSATNCTNSSPKFQVIAGPANSISWTQQIDTTQKGGTAFTKQPEITLLDKGLNIATGSTAVVTVAIHSSDPSSIGGVLTGSKQKTIGSGTGKAVFTDLTIDKAPATYVLRASITDPTNIFQVSQSFDVEIGAVTHLHWLTSPGSCLGGSPCSVQPLIQARDAGNNVVTSITGGPTVVVTINSGTGTLTGTTTIPFVNGVADFGLLDVASRLTLDKIGSYKLNATSSSYSTDSLSFSVTAGPAHSLSWSQEIGTGNCKGGIACTIQPEITLLDKGGNVATGSTAIVTITINSSNPVSNGATLTGTSSKKVSGGTGKAIFTDLTIDKAPATYVLKASITTPTSIHALSSSFNVEVGAVSHLHWFTQPGSCLGGTPCSVQPLIQARDAGNNVVTAYTSGPTVVVTKKSGTGSLTGTTTIAFVNGVADFGQLDVGNRLKIDKIGSDYVLNAKSSDNLHTSDSSTFSVSIGPAAQLFVVHGMDTCKGGEACEQQPVIEVQDAGGNTCTTDSSTTVTISKTSGPGTLSSAPNDFTQGSSSGVATFTVVDHGFKLNTAGSYIMNASIPDASNPGSFITQTFAVTVIVGPTAALEWFREFDGCSGGVACVTQPIINLVDLGQNLVVSDTSVVTLESTLGDVKGGVSEAAGAFGEAGKANFIGNDVLFENAGTYPVKAKLANGISSTVNVTITVGPHARLVWTTPPSGCEGGIPCSVQPKVSIADAGGNTIVGATDVITISIAPPNSSGAIITGDLTRAAVNGVADFSKNSSGIKINLAGSHILKASTASISGLSNTVVVAAGPAAILTFKVPPGGCKGGSVCTTQPEVEVFDAGGVNLCSHYNGSLGVTIVDPNTGITNMTIDIIGGRAIFTNLTLNQKGSYNLIAYTYPFGVEGARLETNVPLTVTVGDPADLVWTTSMSQCLGGIPCAIQPKITIVDAGNNTVDTNKAVAISLTFPESGVTLTGEETKIEAKNGIADFGAEDAQLTIDKTTVGLAEKHTLTASIVFESVTISKTSDVSVAIGPAAQLHWQTGASVCRGGELCDIQPQIHIQDLGGNVVNESSLIVITIVTGPVGGTLVNATTDATTVSGIANFAKLGMTTKGSYKLKATYKDTSIFKETTDDVVVIIGAPHSLEVTTPPSTSSFGGSPFDIQPAVKLIDKGLNICMGTEYTVIPVIDDMSASILPVGAINIKTTTGVAEWGGGTNLAINLKGTYSMKFRVNAVESSSSSITVSVGPPATFDYATVITQCKATEPCVKQAIIKVLDLGTNLVTDDSQMISKVKLSIVSGPVGGTLSGTDSITAVDGVATWPDVGGIKFDKVGEYVLKAEGTRADDTTFSITLSKIIVSHSSPASLVWTKELSNCTGGIACVERPSVTILDAGFNVCTSYVEKLVSIVDTSYLDGPLNDLLGVNARSVSTQAPVNGIANWSSPTNDIILNEAGDHKLVAVLIGTTVKSPTSTVTVSIGTPDNLDWDWNAPQNCKGGEPCDTARVLIKDKGGNTVTSATSKVTIVIDSPNNESTLSGNIQVSAVSGIASFTDLTIDKAATNYILRASITDPTNIFSLSPQISVAIGAVSHLHWFTQPGSCLGGSPCSVQPLVQARDKGNNVVITYTGGPTVVVTKKSGTGSLTGTTTIAFINGVADFALLDIANRLTLDKIGSYRLNAKSSSSGSAHSANSGTFSVTAGQAHSLTWSKEIGTGQCKGGEKCETQPEITLLDEGGNVATGSTAIVTITINSSNPVSSGATLTGTSSKKVSGGTGKAIFTDLTIDKAPATYVLKASITTPTSIHALSSSFNVEVGAVSHLHWFTQPGSCLGGTPCSVQPLIQARDAGNNVVTAYTGGPTVVVTKKSGTGSLTGTTTIAFVNGVADFGQLDVGNRLKIDKIGSDYVLNAKSSDNLHTSDSSTISVNVGSATSLHASITISGCKGGSICIQQPVIEIQDAGGNTRTMDSSSSITISIFDPLAGQELFGASGLTFNAVKGVVTFKDIRMTKEGLYTLQFVQKNILDVPYIATVATLKLSTNVVIGPVASLEWTRPFKDCVGGTICVEQPIVTAKDLGNNIVTSLSKDITIRKTSGPSINAKLSGITTKVTTEKGVADFKDSGMKFDIIGTYEIEAVIIDLGIVSVKGSIEVTLGSRETISFTQNMSGCLGGEICSQMPIVTIYDAGGNVKADEVGEVIIQIKTGPVGGTLSMSGVGDFKATVKNGHASFTGLSIDLVGDYTLEASVDTHTAQSGVVAVSVGSVVGVKWDVQPSGCTGGSVCSTSPVVKVIDRGGNAIGSEHFAGKVLISKFVGPDSLQPPGVGLKDVKANGLVDYSSPHGIMMNVACSGDEKCYVLNAVAQLDGKSVGASAKSEAFAVTVGDPADLVWTTPISQCFGGSPCGTMPVIKIVDAGNNTVDTNLAVTISLTFPKNDVALSGAKTSIAAKNGIADFGAENAQLTIDKTTVGLAEKHTLTAKIVSKSETISKSSDVSVAIGPAAGFYWPASKQPSGCKGGESCNVSEVTLVDLGGNIAKGSTSTISITIDSSDPVSNGATLTGTTSKKVSTGTGKSSFTDLTIDKAPASYILQASITHPTNASIKSSTIAVTVGEVSDLTWLHHPNNAEGGTVFEHQPTLRVVDKGHNTVTTYSGAVYMRKKETTCVTSTLSGMFQISFVKGIADFSLLDKTKQLKMDKIGTNCQLKATTVDNLYTSDSSVFAVTVGPAARLSVSSAISGARGGEVFDNMPVIQIQDAGGNLCITNNDTTVSIDTVPTGSLLGTLEAKTINGIATFDKVKNALKILTKGVYNLEATAKGNEFFPRVRPNFTISHLHAPSPWTVNVQIGKVVSLQWARGFSSCSGGVPCIQMPIVSLHDMGGNIVLNDDTDMEVNIAIGDVSPNGSSAIAGTTLMQTNSGMADFTGKGLIFDKAGDYEVVATWADKASKGAIEESKGISTSISSPPLMVAVSVGASSHIEWTKLPGECEGGHACKVHAEIKIFDKGGNVVLSEDGNEVSITIHHSSLNKSQSGQILTGTSDKVVAVFKDGKAQFPNLIIDKVDTYILTASTSGIAPVQSSVITVKVGDVENVQWANDLTGCIGAEVCNQAILYATDRGGNIVPTFTENIKFQLKDELGATLKTLEGKSWALGHVCSPHCEKSFVKGIATLNDVAIDRVGTYVIVASIPSVLDDEGNPIQQQSGSITVASGHPFQLFWSQRLSGCRGGEQCDIMPFIEIQDKGRNRVETETSKVTLQLLTYPDAAKDLDSNKRLVGDFLQKNAVNGIADFSTAKIKLPIVGDYNIEASVGGKMGKISSAIQFTVSVGFPVEVRWTLNPNECVSMLPCKIHPKITLYDLGGNIAIPATEADSRNVSISIVSAPKTRKGKAASLFGTTSSKALNGVADFASNVDKLTMDATGKYKLKASFISKGGNIEYSATSAEFSVAVGAESSLEWVSTFTGCVGGSQCNTYGSVEVLDAGGNLVTESSTSITVAIDSPTDNDSTLKGTVTKSLSKTGIAHFDDLVIDKAHSKYILRASTPAPLSLAVNSSSFAVVVGPPHVLVWQKKISGCFGGTSCKVQPIVVVEDKGGNTVVPAYGGEITLKMEAGPSGITSPGGHVSAAGSLRGDLVRSCSSGSSNWGDTDVSKPLVFDTSGIYSVSACVALYDDTNKNSSNKVVLPCVNESVDVLIGEASQLEWTANAEGCHGGQKCYQNPVVSILDAGSNVVTTSFSHVVLSISEGPANGEVSAGVMKAKNGVADFRESHMHLNIIGTYTLLATVSLGGKASIEAKSSSFSVLAGVLSYLIWSREPAGCIGGKFCSTQPSVTAVDAGYNVITDGPPLELSLEVLVGPGVVSASTALTEHGVATWDDLSLDVAGTYVLSVSATDNKKLSAASKVVNVRNGNLTTVKWTTIPSECVGGSPCKKQPVLTFTDSAGNQAFLGDMGVDITIEIKNGPPDSTIKYNTDLDFNDVTAVKDLTLNVAGEYTLEATVFSHWSGKKLVSLDPVNVTVGVGPPATVEVVGEISGCRGGDKCDKLPDIVCRDLGGNKVLPENLPDDLKLEASLVVVQGPSGGVMQEINGDKPFDFSCQKALLRQIYLDSTSVTDSTTGKEGDTAITMPKECPNPANEKVPASTMSADGMSKVPENLGLTRVGNYTIKPVVTLLGVDSLGQTDTQKESDEKKEETGEKELQPGDDSKTPPKNGQGADDSGSSRSRKLISVGQSMTISGPETQVTVEQGNASQLIWVTEANSCVEATSCQIFPLIALVDSGANLVKLGNDEKPLQVELKIISSPEGGAIHGIRAPLEDGFAVFTGLMFDLTGSYVLRAEIVEEIEGATNPVKGLPLDAVQVIRRICPANYYGKSGKCLKCPNGFGSPEGSTAVGECIQVGDKKDEINEDHKLNTKTETSTSILSIILLIALILSWCCIMLYCCLFCWKRRNTLAYDGADPDLKWWQKIAATRKRNADLAKKGRFNDAESAWKEPGQDHQGVDVGPEKEGEHKTSIISAVM